MQQETSSSENPDGMESLRRRHHRVSQWFVVFVVLIPGGCIIPGILAMVLPESAKGYCVMAGILLPFVGLGGVVLMLSDQSKYRRSMALAAEGNRLGLGFIERPAASDYPPVAHLKMYGNVDEHHGGTNLLHGTVREVPVYVMEYCYSIGHGKNAAAIDQTVVLMPDAVTGAPDFITTPRDWRDKLSKMLGESLVEFPDRPGLKRWAVRGPDPVAITAAMTPRLEAQLNLQPTYAVESHQGMLVVVIPYKKIPPGKYHELLAAAWEIKEALQEANALPG